MSRCLLLCLALTPAVANAADWSQVGSSDRVVVYVDRASIKKLGGKVKAWTLWEFNTPQSSPAGDFRSRKTLFTFDCTNGTFADTQAILYAEPNGNGQSYSSPPFEPVFREPAPETVGEGVYESICAGVTKGGA